VPEYPLPKVPDRPFFNWLGAHPLFLRIRKLLRRVKPWRDENVNLFDVCRFFVLGMINGSVSSRSAAISFRLFLAFFPAMLLILSLIPFTPLDTEMVLDSMRMLFPDAAVELFEQTVQEFLTHRQGTLLSVGFVLLIFYASSSVNALLTGFGESYHLRERPDWLKFRLWSLLLLMVLGVFLGVAVLLVGFAGDALVWAESRDWISSEAVPWLILVRWMLAVGLIYASVNVLYQVGNQDRKKWIWRSVGTSVATAMIILLSLGFSYFIGQFASYNKLYGSLGTLLITLVWVNANSTMLLLGFELDASIIRAQREAGKRKRKRNHHRA
jgi:membrane protein